MRVVDLTPEYEKLFFVCLEDWSSEMCEAGDHKACWYRRMTSRTSTCVRGGLRVKLALDDDGQLGGMIQYVPIEESFAEGRDAWFIQCLWVHGHREGRGNYQGRGMGSALLAAAEQDARERGGQAMVAWGVSLPVFVRASWYKKHGYQVCDKAGLSLLVWKPFGEEAQAPHWVRPYKQPETVPGVVSVTGFINGWCSVQNMVHERARRAVAALQEIYGQRIVFRSIDTCDPEIYGEWGIADALYLDERSVPTGPPPSYERLYRIFRRRLRHQLRRGRLAPLESKE